MYSWLSFLFLSTLWNYTEIRYLHFMIFCCWKLAYRVRFIQLSLVSWRIMCVLYSDLSLLAILLFLLNWWNILRGPFVFSAGILKPIQILHCGISRVHINGFKVIYVHAKVWPKIMPGLSQIATVISEFHIYPCQYRNCLVILPAT